jgi:flagellar basal-body rod protein FlgG
MDLALMLAKSGLEAHHKSIEIISNNLANANTTAFKRNRPEFEELPYQEIKQPGAPITQDVNSTSGVMIGTGTKLANNKKIFIEGSQIQTGNQLDVMIAGRGFLKVQSPDGSTFAYTRAGNLTKNDQNQLMTVNGYIVQPVITVPQDAGPISIAEDGTVSVQEPGTTTLQQIGQLTLTDFINPDGLEPIGGNLYLPTTSSGAGTDGTPAADGYGAIKQGVLESSNVNVVEEMVNLIEAQRAFEVTSKAVSAVDNMLQYLVRET